MLHSCSCCRSCASSRLPCLSLPPMHWSLVSSCLGLHIDVPSSQLPAPPPPTSAHPTFPTCPCVCPLPVVPAISFPLDPQIPLHPRIPRVLVTQPAPVRLQLACIHLGCLCSRICLLQLHLHLLNPLLILLFPCLCLFATCGPTAPLSSSFLFCLLSSLYRHRHLSFVLVLWLTCSSKDSARVRMRILHLLFSRSSHEATPLGLATNPPPRVLPCSRPSLLPASAAFAFDPSRIRHALEHGHHVVQLASQST